MCSRLHTVFATAHHEVASSTMPASTISDHEAPPFLESSALSDAMCWQKPEFYVGKSPNSMLVTRPHSRISYVRV